LRLRRISVLIAIAVAVFLLTASIQKIGRGEVGLTGAGEDVRVMGTGLHLVRPFSEVVRFKLRQNHSLRGSRALEVALRQGGQVSVDLDLEMVLAEQRVKDLYRDYGDRFFDRVVLPVVRLELASALSEETGRSKADLDRLGGLVAERAGAKLRPFGADVASLAIAGVTEAGAPVHNLVRGEGVKVFVLGLDAYDWIIMDKVAESVDLANIRKIRREGAWGDLESIEPLVSPLIWTTMVTGVTPDIHGITDFLVRDPATGEDIPVTSSMRKVPAIWNMTSLFDLTCGFIGWFASFPAEHVKGFIVSDRFGYHMFDPAWKKGGRSPSVGLTYPATVFDEIEPLTVDPEDVDADMARYIRGEIKPERDQAGGAGAQGGHGPPDPETSLRQVISSYRTYENVMKKLYPEYAPDIFAVYFEFTDSVCHLFMKSMAPAMNDVSAEDARRYGGAIAATYAEADRLLGDVLDMLDDDTVLLVVSDHGFKSGEFRPLSDSRIGFGQAVDWHRIKGSIAMYGNIVKPGYEIKGASVIDIGPTLLYLLGLPVDSKMMGKVLLDAFTDEWVGSHPVNYTSAYDSLIAPPAASTDAGPGSQALKDKLVSLGYVAGGQSSLANLANYYHKNGKYAEAIEIYKQMLEAEPDNIDAKIGMSTAYIKSGKAELGVRMLNEILERHPDNLEVLHTLGNYYVDAGDGPMALAVAERALKVDANNGESHFIKGIGLQRMGRYQEAAEAFRKAITLAPDMPEIYADLAMIYVNSGRAQEAMDLVDKALELSPERPDILYIKGLALGRMGNTVEALHMFSKVMELDDTHMPACLAAAGILFSRGEYDSVLALCDAAADRAGGYTAYLHDMKANTYVKKNRYQDAIDEYKAAVEADPSLPGPSLNFARLLIYRGRTQEARKVLEDLLSHNPGQPEAGRLLQSLGSE
jgi:tetratricopeptide (TPR) repeat protein/predicted AlkP superfamily phosphohydrolase/phosphomutase